MGKGLQGVFGGMVVEMSKTVEDYALTLNLLTFSIEFADKAHEFPNKFQTSIIHKHISRGEGTK